MACQAIRSWTLSKLIGAFLDLAIAYVLLCCSTVAFFVSKFLGFFGFSLPCPCNGFLNKPNPDHCLQKLLVDCPTDNISAVQLAVKSRLPFDSVWGRNEDCQLSFKVVRESKLESGVIELEGEASCSSVSVAKRSQPSSNTDLLRKNEGLAAAEEGKYDVKGKGVARSRRQRSNLRRRRRSSNDQSKLTPSSSYDNVRPGAPVAPLSKYGNSNTWKESSQTLDSHDAVEPSHIMELDHKSWLSSESNGFMETIGFLDKEMGTLGSERNDTGQHLEHDSHLENAVKILEQALYEERAARAALFFDLEKERTAAATAADEAMAMISRLQEEKAAIELEARQYERTLEEKFTYDAVEMDILKEIIIRREREKHFLEKEVESYRTMLEEKEQLEEDACNALDTQGETLHQQLQSTGTMRSTSDFTDYASISAEKPLPLSQCHDIPEIAEQDDSSFVEFSQEFQEKSVLSGASLEGPFHDHGYQEKSVVLIGEVKNDLETESNGQYDGRGQAIILAVQEQHLHDIHVIDNRCTSQGKDNAGSSVTHDDTSKTVGKCELLSEALEVQRRTPEIFSSLPPSSSSTYESKVPELRRHSIAAVDHERLKLNNEVGLLREKLMNIQAGREKLNFSMGHKDKGETELLLLEDIGNLLQEIRQLTEPQKAMRRTSLPPPGSKDISKKRRCRSASVGLYQSS